MIRMQISDGELQSMKIFYIIVLEYEVIEDETSFVSFADTEFT